MKLSVRSSGLLSTFLILFLLSLLTRTLLDQWKQRFDLPTSRTALPPVPEIVPISQAEALLGSGQLNLTNRLTGALNPFYTAYFEPPPPKPPVMKNFQLSYLGFYESADGKKQAFIKVADTYLVGGAGCLVVGDFVVSEIGLQTLVLKSSRGPIQALPFRATQQVEVPVP